VDQSKASVALLGSLGLTWRLARLLKRRTGQADLKIKSADKAFGLK